MQSLIVAFSILISLVISLKNFLFHVGSPIFHKHDFQFKSVFHKDDFEWVHFSNKHHKSHVWPKNFKKQKMYFLATLAYQKVLGIVITFIEPLTYTSFLNGFGHSKITFKFRIWLIHIHLILRLGKKSKKTITKYVYIYIWEGGRIPLGGPNNFLYLT